MDIDRYSEVFESHSTVMCVFAHPDDMEINCGGLVARLCGDGKRVIVVAMTAGECGVGDRMISVEEYRGWRLRALSDAARVLGIDDADVHCLGLVDGMVDASIANIGLVVELIRRFRPGLVITHEPAMHVHGLDPQTIWLNHRDHRHTASIVFDAVYPYSRDRAFFPEQIRAGLAGHSVHTILFGDAFGSKFEALFDVTDTRAPKAEALGIHLATGSISQAEYDAYTTEGERGGRFYETLGVLANFH